MERVLEPQGANVFRYSKDVAQKETHKGYESTQDLHKVNTDKVSTREEAWVQSDPLQPRHILYSSLQHCESYPEWIELPGKYQLVISTSVTPICVISLAIGSYH